MKTLITFEQAKHFHPNEVKIVQDLAEQKLKKSKAKNKAQDISELEWSYESCVLIEPLNMERFMKGNLPSDAPMCLEDRIEDEINRTKVRLEACMRGARVSTDLEEVPEILEKIKTYIEVSHNKKIEYEALSSEAKTKQMKDALKSLSNGKGFFKDKSFDILKRK